MDKRFWGVIALIAVVFVGIVWANGRQAGAPNGDSSSATATNHVKGENAKKVTLVEYGDFQCPICALYEPTIKEVFEKYQADIEFQFRNFPLQQIHQNAFAAARAAEAAGLQGKYWEMHDQLYIGQTGWSTSTNPLSIFEQYAKTIAIDPAKFKADFTSEKVNDVINADIREGDKLKITGTPAFFINGKKVELSQLVDSTTNGPSVEKFSKLIEDAIKEQSAKSSQ